MNIFDICQFFLLHFYTVTKRQQKLLMYIINMNTNARSRLLDTGQVLSFRFSQPSVRAGLPGPRVTVT